ncbi:uncharacterized protein LOC128546409 [Mercenaria mercenaria]|uniref:uncharacterized protein LOC128546409 n=1 Tax=Mercenaria mercenaria TaxID=6596 RepID=UPI00234F46AC|nr:uncharacterized protein LOC128546409 [Mercenaria mercenaria]
MCLALPKGAETWYMNLTAEVKNDFEKLKQAFTRRYANLDSRTSLYTRYINSKQGSRTVQDYVESVTSLGRDLGKSESDILDKVIHGLRMDIQKFVVLKEVKTLDELLKSAKMSESSENEDKTLRDSDQANHNVRVNRTRESRQPYRRDNQNPQYRRRFHEREKLDRQKCRHCGRCGHLSLRCRFKNARCYKCNQIGHIARAHSAFDR